MLGSATVERTDSCSLSKIWWQCSLDQPHSVPKINDEFVVLPVHVEHE